MRDDDYQRALDRQAAFYSHYNEQAQVYAKGGMQALAIINGGAALGTLSQLSKLHEFGLHKAGGCAILLWCIGLTLAATVWISGFLSSRYAARSVNLGGKHLHQDEERKSDSWLHCALGGWLLSLLCFFIGVIVLVSAFISVDAVK